MISIKLLLKVILIIQIVISGRLSKDEWICCCLLGVSVVYNVSDDKKVELLLHGASEYVIKIAAVDGTLSYVLAWPRNAGMLPLYVYLYVCMSVCLYVCLTVCLSACQPVRLPARPPARLSVHLFFRLSSPLPLSLFPLRSPSLFHCLVICSGKRFVIQTHICVSVTKPF